MKHEAREGREGLPLAISVLVLFLLVWTLSTVACWLLSQDGRPLTLPFTEVPTSPLVLGLLHAWLASALLCAWVGVRPTVPRWPPLRWSRFQR